LTLIIPNSYYKCNKKEAIVKLKKYLQKNRLTPLEFAYITKLGINTIYRFLQGYYPTPTTARKIEEATQGALKVEDLIDPKKVIK
jgi:predicted transcriptional regulator